MFRTGDPRTKSSAAGLATLPRFGELAVPLREDFRLSSFELVLRSDIADGTVETDRVVMLHVTGYRPSRLLQRQRGLRPDALALARNTRYTLLGLTATMSRSNIMNASRRYPSSGYSRWNSTIARFSSSSTQ